jgi:ABC-type sugar transport system substrate-binding protein
MTLIPIRRTGLALLLALAACSEKPAPETARTSEAAASSPTGKQLVIGSVLYGTDGYQTRHGAAMEEYGQSLGVKIVTCNSEVKVEKQQSCIDDLVAAKVDGIVLQPVEPAAASAFVKKAQAANIPLVTWAVGPVPNVSVPWVDLAEKEQAFDAGKAAAQWVKDNLKKAPKLVVLGVPNNTNCMNREEGFIGGAKSVDPAAEVVARPNGKGSRLESANEMATVIDSGREFNIVTGCNGESTLGALQSLRAAGRGKAVDKKPVSEYMFSIDGTTAEVKELLDRNSPLMQTLALAPYDNVRVLLDTMLKRVKNEIDDNYKGGLKDTLLPADCAKVNEILKVQYGSTVQCPA